MSDREQNRPVGRIPARVMYENDEQVPSPMDAGQDMPRRSDRARVPMNGEAAPRYVPGQTQYVSKRVSRSQEPAYGAGRMDASPAPQQYERRRRSQRHAGDNGDMPVQEMPRVAPPMPVRPAMPQNRPSMDQGPVPGQGRPQGPGANYARVSRQEDFAPVRARQTQQVPAYLEEEEEAPRRGHTGLTVLLVLVLLIALFLAGLFFVLPGRDTQQSGGIVNTLNDVKDSITQEVGLFVKSVKNVIAPEAKDPPQVQEFQVAPPSGQAPIELAFTITTTNTVEAVRVCNDQGQILGEQQDAPLVKEEKRIIWSLKLTMQSAYNGTVSAQMLSEGSWMDSGKTVPVIITESVVVPAETPVAATQEPATPTMEAVEETPEPTQMPTDTPAPTDTPEPTEEPTEEPTAEPTPEPTPEPSPTLTPMPYMAAAATEGTDPSQLKITSKVYSGNKSVTDFTRSVPVKMNGPDNYAIWSGAVLTFRGGPFRQNAAYGTVDVQENRLEVAWSSPMGGISTYNGSGWTGQPAIVKWIKEVREMMNIKDEKKAVTALKEVILASQDGKIYFLDLADGQPTRDPINVGYPLKGSVSIDPRGMPILGVGQGVSKIGSTVGNIGYYLFNLIDQKQLYFLNGRDKNAFGTNGAFDGSSLTDLNSDTMVIAGENGMLYTLSLKTAFDVNGAKLTAKPEIVSYKTKTTKQKDNQTGFESSVAMYGNYVYMVDATGILQCVDVNTMKPVWAVDTDDNTDATIALDFDEDGTLALYTGNTVKEQGKNGVCTIRRLNALTGVQDWVYNVNVQYDPEVTGGCMASPVVGKNSISNLVIFTVAKTAEGGQIIAFDKKTGDVVWQQPMSNYSWSSPVAVYNQNGDAWIIQGDSEGVLSLMYGQTGAVANSIQLEGAITGSPAVYNDTLVVGTSGKNTSKIYGVKIK